MSFNPVSIMESLFPNLFPSESGGNSESDGKDDALIAMSDNNKQVALQQIQAQAFALEQGALDRELQLAANLELSFEKFDTKLQVSKLEYTQQMMAEENRHVEKLAESKNKLHKMQSTYSLGADLPAPPSEEN